MKGRSHRLPQSDPLDDWGDGSWTVDCSCGVTFDDGEEMVNCDECGVWVHTRCSRFVKGEASFACDKCKAKKPRAVTEHATNTEETEVAQLLVELPTKTDPCPPPPPLQRGPFRLWTDIPMEERVHVQGVPGGDPALFQGLSSVFTSELWKCAGYVPKKFNFQYREFPCWDEEESENPASRGADLLFSLSKEIVPHVPVETFERKPSPKGARKREGGKVLFGSRSHGSGKKERSKLRVFGVHSGHRRKEESVEGKDRSGKKKARISADKAMADNKRRGSIPLVDMNRSDFCEDGGLQVADSDAKIEDRREDMLSEPNSANHPEGMSNENKPKRVLVVKASRGGSSDEALKHKSSLETSVDVKKVCQIDPARPGISSWIDDLAASHGKGSVFSKVSVKDEDDSKAVHGVKQPKDESLYEWDLNGSTSSAVMDLENSKPASGDPMDSYADGSDVPMDMNTNGTISLSSKLDNIEVKIERGDDQTLGNSELLSCPVTDGKLESVEHVPLHLQRLVDHSSENLVEQEVLSSLPSDEQKSQYGERDPEVSHQDCDNIPGGLLTNSSEPKQQTGVVESAGSMTGQKDSSEPSNCLYADKHMNLGGPNLSHQAPRARKLVVGVGKASSVSSAPVIPRSSVSGGNKVPGTTAPSTASKAIHLTKQQRVKVNICSVGKKDNSTTVVSGEESMPEVPTLEKVSRQKDHPKAPVGSGSKSSQISRISYASATKHTLSDAKEQLFSPSSKASTTENTTISSGSHEPTGSPQIQSASPAQTKMSSGSCQKSENINQPIPQPSSKMFSHSTAMHPPPSFKVATTLSDEELALLLHQELNSSPRVPRVPRMRQVGGIQLASPSATTLLSKRSSTSGGKDHISVSRRKNKEDARRDTYRNSHELIDESKRMDKLPSSPDHKQQELALRRDGSAEKDALNMSPDTMAFVKKSIPVASTTGANSSSSSIEANTKSALSIHSSPRDVLDGNGGPIPRTLPGLIGEIMSKGRRMTYEELCNSVLPHWQNLRKPNGERYAYSSHSQAVLDCLRNRIEWAHLVDRGPKSNPSKKRRKPDTDPPVIESENGEAKNKVLREAEDKNSDPHREDFPKGKRKARKRRRLILKGQGVKGVRNRRKHDTVSDEDPVAFSQSSNEGTESTAFSEDESQAVGRGAVGSEVSSSSSDDTD